jgi:hypothetical protein
MRILVRSLAFALLLTACSREEEAPPLPEQAAAPGPPAAVTSAQTPLRVRSADGATVMTVAFSGEVADLALGDGTSARKLRGEPRDSGKRKYSLDGSDTQLEVKPGDGGDFKLRGADGSLRWKVKLDADKIRISDNEQNDNPFELKKREGDRTKVFGPGDRELGNVRFDRAAAKTVVEDASGKELYVIEAPNPSAAWGVLLLHPIPDIHRHVLIAELLARGR